MDRTNYKYVYSADTANYLMLHNAICKGTGLNKKTGCIFWCFDKDEVEPIFKYGVDIALRTNKIQEKAVVRINNLNQACAYVKEGVIPIGVEYDNNLKKMIFVFRELDTKQVWKKWKRHEIEL